MKYLISSDGETLAGNVSSHFGRAPFFLVYDDETRSLRVQANDDGVDPHLVIRDTAKAGVKKMICGAIGPHAYDVAKHFNLEVCIVSGIPVGEAVELAIEGKLPVTNGPTVHHHHHEHGGHTHQH